MSRTLAFILTMPGVGSWNGVWSGAGETRAVVRAVSQGKADALDGQTFSYSWDDGWRAAISVRKVDSTEARRLRRVSVGFYGYEWMVDSILLDGEIVAPSDRQTAAKAEGQE